MTDLNQVRRYYEVLGVGPSCSPNELKQAYRDQVFVWHPDRFHQNPRLRAKSEEQSKLINAAYQFLSSHHGEFSEEQLTGGRSGSTDELESIRQALEQACAAQTELRRSLNELSLQASNNRRHFQSALKRAYSQRKGAEIRAEKLEQQLAAAMKLSVFWCRRASEQQARREKPGMNRISGRPAWGSKQVIWTILILLMVFSLCGTLGVIPALAIVGLVSWFVIRRFRKRQMNSGTGVPPPFSGGQVPLSHPFEQAG
jgi:hypothetical protein